MQVTIPQMFYNIMSAMSLWAQTAVMQHLGVIQDQWWSVTQGNWLKS